VFAFHHFGLGPISELGVMKYPLYFEGCTQRFSTELTKMAPYTSKEQNTIGLKDSLLQLMYVADFFIFFTEIIKTGRFMKFNSGIFIKYIFMHILQRE
jgi:hypothetical protein